MAIPMVAGVGATDGAGGVSQLAQLYRQQLLNGTAGVGGAGATAGTDPATASRGADFAKAVGDSLQSLEGLDKTASTKAVQAATGDLHDVQDYVIAATQAQVATELTTTVRNKALDAFSEIMRMPL